MTKSLKESCDEIRNHNADYSDFPVGTRVKVSTYYEDEFFFRATEIGTVVENTGGYLGVIVRFDDPMRFEGGFIKYDHNFAPSSLTIINDKSNTEHPCLHCGK